MIKLAYRHLSENDKRDICAWKYDGEYDIYDLPPYHEMQEKQIGFMNPKAERNFYGFWDGDLLVGFVNILEEATEVFIGIGVNPTYCGQHYGRQMLCDAYNISKNLYPGKPLYLEVRSWNMRAVRCYLNAGFSIDGDPFEQTTGIGTGTFYRMVKA